MKVFPRLRLWLLLPLLLILLSALPVLVWRFVPVTVSSFMLQARVRALTDDAAHPAFKREWQPWEQLPAHLKRAVVAAEDQRFYLHHGFDFEALQRAWRHNQGHRRVRGGSTISQQLAKNLFLWPGRSYLRKGLEAWFTVLIEALWPKQRILEVYLNVVEFGDQTYGAEAAAQRYFGKPAARLSRHEAALLAAVLPSPRRWLAARPSAFVQKRAARIEAQGAPVPP